jgi:hypothetical protein
MKKVHRVAGVMPQEVVCPAARFPSGIHIGAAKKVRLHIHLLNLQFTGHDFFVNVLMAGVEPARVTTHADYAGFFLHFYEALGVRKRIGDGNFDLHMNSRAHALFALPGVHLSGRR